MCLSFVYKVEGQDFMTEQVCFQNYYNYFRLKAAA